MTEEYDDRTSERWLVLMWHGTTTVDRSEIIS